ncbi:MAG: cation transporter [Paludibacteraceae bacterium]|nr:cation transporter [Paludibacteraceae bacterium]
MTVMVFVLCSLFYVQPASAAQADKQVVVLSCDLHCQGCCDKIMKNIAFEKGVKDLVCNLEEKTVTVTYDANKTNVPALLKAFDKIGKPAKVKREPVAKQNFKLQPQKL